MTLAYLEEGDLQGAAQCLLPALELKAGEEIDPELEFALCAVFLSSIEAPNPLPR